ncbi:sigma-54 interaction domain-containing protein [Calditrichota bacterium]
MSSESTTILDHILGESEPIARVKGLIRQVAPSDITVLVTGESGSGKELVTSAIHSLSERSRGPLISVNCGAIPEGIFESEVFGHEKGSFTSADQRRQGYFEMADKGTLFLDEIGEMPLQVQVKILRVLETGKFNRVGGSHEIGVDVRVIAATNKDLEMEANRGRFRQDLYFRLKAVNINVPPLRDRPEDIPLLVRHFTREFCTRNNRPCSSIEPHAVDLMKRHYWKGNIRELKNFVESMLALSQDDLVTMEDVRDNLDRQRGSLNLPVIVSKPAEDVDRDMIYSTLLELRYDINSIKALLQQFINQQAKPPEYPTPFSDAQELEAYTLEDVEREQIKKILDEFNGNRRRAADALGIGERTLYRRLKHFGLD